MNKQEVIEKIKNICTVETFMSENVWVKRDEVLDVINQLDESEKNVEKRYKVLQKKSGLSVGIQQQDGSVKAEFTKEELSEYGFDNLDVYEVKEVEE